MYFILSHAKCRKYYSICIIQTLSGKEKKVMPVKIKKY